MNSTKQITTSAGGERAANDRLRTDWDADGTTSIHLPTDVAERLLAERGWAPSPRGGWSSPSGQHYWHTDEALQVALIAENA